MKCTPCYFYNVCVLLLVSASSFSSDSVDFRPKCNGENDGCCTASSPCGRDDGDCDGDSECAGDLVCGEDNCDVGPATGYSATDDCCVRMVTVFGKEKRDRWAEEKEAEYERVRRHLEEHPSSPLVTRRGPRGVAG